MLERTAALAASFGLNALLLAALALGACGGEERSSEEETSGRGVQTPLAGAAREAAEKAGAAAQQAATTASAAAQQAANTATAAAQQAAAQAEAGAQAAKHSMGSLGAAAIPAGDLRGDPAKGATLYATYCASCHGPGGKGDGPVAATLNPKPANHTDKAYMGSLTDQQLYQVIDKGGASVGKSPLMAPWGPVIGSQGVKDLIAHVRKLSGT